MLWDVLLYHLGAWIQNIYAACVMNNDRFFLLTKKKTTKKLLSTFSIIKICLLFISDGYKTFFKVSFGILLTKRRICWFWRFFFSYFGATDTRTPPRMVPYAQHRATLRTSRGRPWELLPGDLENFSRAVFTSPRSNRFDSAARFHLFKHCQENWKDK